MKGDGGELGGSELITYDTWAWLNWLQVIKMGTSSLVHEELRTVRLSTMAQLSETVRKLRDQGVRPLLGDVHLCRVLFC